ncbi:unnamed protein product [Rotaria sp. Silwood2]|nr:unnamed protein product [Rotaria sp. Silwood2]CAF2814938.1 unnamed protein product [Rotaria sp. Silwood2]CAF4083176.1 unnamed protein product [Rotaria sp. Silwood2]CAF4251339.1 unnamed protein product [Rotaria sp. Silwood2]
MLSSYWSWIIPSVIVFVLIIVGILLFLHLTINPNFEVHYLPAVSSPVLLTNATSASNKYTLVSTSDTDTIRAAPAPINSAATPSSALMDDATILFNKAKSVWAIISKNAATADIHTIHGNVLPANINNPLELQSWSPSPVSRSCSLTIHNRLGLRVLQFDYDLEFLYGGSLNGRGAYLDGITVVPSRTSVAWCYVFNAKVEITSVRNVGTSDNPVAAAHVELKYQLKGLSRVEGTTSFDVKGDGRVDVLHSK